MWTSLLKYGKGIVKGVGQMTANTGKAAGNAVIHPATTISKLGTATKNLAVGGAAAYVGWEALTTDKSVAKIVGDKVIGENATTAVGDSVDATIDTVRGLTEKAGAAADAISNATASLDSKWNGIGEFFKNITNGNGLNMFGNFFNNLGKGNVSGMSILGLLAGAWLTFGRFGWLGKIGGLLLSMLMIGNNSRQQTNTQSLAQNQNNNERKGIRR